MKTRKKYRVNIARVRNIAMGKVLKIDKLYLYNQRILIPYTVDGLAQQSQGKQTKSVQANSLFKSFYFSPIFLQPRKYDNEGQFSTTYLQLYRKGCYLNRFGFRRFFLPKNAHPTHPLPPALQSIVRNSSINLLCIYLLTSLVASISQKLLGLSTIIMYVI